MMNQETREQLRALSVEDDPHALYQVCQLRLREGQSADEIVRELGEVFIKAVPREKLGPCLYGGVAIPKDQFSNLNDLVLKLGLLRPLEGCERLDELVNVLGTRLEEIRVRRMKAELTPLEAFRQVMESGKVSRDVAGWRICRIYGLSRLPRGAGAIARQAGRRDPPQ